MTNVWMIRLGKYGENEPRALQDGKLATGWDLSRELETCSSREEILAYLEPCYPSQKQGTIQNWAVQINQLKHQVEPNDLVVLPLKTSGEIAIGRVKGGFMMVDGKHPGREVIWLVTDLPRQAVKQDLLYSLGASQTICRISRNNAADRFAELARSRRDPGPSLARHMPTMNKGDAAEGEDAEVDVQLDLAEIARQQIEEHISANFAGHEFTHLIAAILEAQGYRTEVTLPGADRGIDIVAGKGALGFDSPRLVVQVKSGDIVGDQPTLQSLIGSVQDAHADQGLLVCWSGFKSTVRSRINELYFRIRLWGREEVLDELFDVFDDLSDEMKAKLRLQRMWAVVPEEA
ncbi:restriction endonuclease [uncultured Maricaulis sp.]|uniref:restriction endonuclease n=1 Tax=uncultured Maricaulis sp. TaxID=174710 RepID=UPI0030D9B2E8|tara:strand:+ start:39945 stop:40985 length:1041 start_codon:yes stop_codon:yes gene_type:complete